MNSGIFYTTRAITGREGHNLCRHLSILNSAHDVVDMLTGNSENGKKTTAEYVTTSQYRNHYGSFYKNEARNMKDWMQVYDAINPIFLKEYSALYLIGGLDLHRSNLGRFENRAGIFPRDSGQLKFESAGIHLVNILALLKAHHTYNIPLHEIAFDPNEMSCDLFHQDVAPRSNYTLYHGYDIPLYAAKRLDSLQYWLKKQVDLWETDKTIDFTFGYTVLKNSGRDHYPQTIDQVSNQFASSKVFVKNEYTGENTHVSGDVYLNHIKASRYTYMLPSYNAHCFSIYRFLESIHHDCLPLIHSDCNITDVAASYGVEAIFKILQNGSVPSESDRLSILNTLKEKMLGFDKSFVNL